jgi:Domain of unknown function (DUF4124)
VRVWLRFLVGSVFLGGLVLATRAQGIYTCTDAKGRRLTSDRPIPECLDREQKELSSSGTVKRTVQPTPTALERAEIEEQDKRKAEAAARVAEDKRRERALLSRYPNRAAHDKERTDSLAQVDSVIVVGEKRMSDLVAQRRKMDVELEFFRKDMSKMPPALKRQLDDVEQSIVAQKRFLANQDMEKKRINMRFDTDLIKLQELWAQQAAHPSGAVAARPASASAAR